MEHLGIVVDDLEDAVAFFQDIGLVLDGRTTVSGDWVDRIIGLSGAEVLVAMLETPDGAGRIELSQFITPAGAPDGPHAANVPGLRHVAFRVDDIDATLARLTARGAELVGELTQYRDVYKLCYLRGPAGIIVELAQPLR